MRKWISLVESAQSLPRFIYHGTSVVKAQSIVQAGHIAGPSWWGSKDIACYYAEGEDQEDHSGMALLRVALSRFDQSDFEIDYPSIEEPLVNVLGYSPMLRWDEAEDTWQNCLAIYQSVMYDANLVVKKADLILLPPRKKKELNRSVLSTYERIERLGSEASPEDLETKAFIEREYDMSTSWMVR